VAHPAASRLREETRCEAHAKPGKAIFDRSDGERTPVRNTGAIIEITNRKLAEDRTDFVYFIDRAGRFLYANKALLNLWV
jgi:hypothetical protein